MDGYDSFINNDGEGVAKGDPNEERCQGPPDPSEISEIKYNSDEERAANSYDQYIGDEVVPPNRRGEKLIEKVRKRIRYYDTSTGEGNYNAICDKSLYKIEYPDGNTEQLSVNIIAKNMLSQVESEDHHY